MNLPTRISISQKTRTPKKSNNAFFLLHFRVSLHHETRGKANSKSQEGSAQPWNGRLEWTRVGHLKLPLRSTQEDGVLVLENITAAEAGSYRCTGSTPISIAHDEALLIVTHKPRWLTLFAWTTCCANKFHFLHNRTTVWGHHSLSGLVLWFSGCFLNTREEE